MNNNNNNITMDAMMMNLTRRRKQTYFVVFIIYNCVVCDINEIKLFIIRIIIIIKYDDENAVRYGGEQRTALWWGVKVKSNYFIQRHVTININFYQQNHRGSTVAMVFVCNKLYTADTIILYTQRGLLSTHVDVVYLHSSTWHRGI